MNAEIIPFTEPKVIENRCSFCKLPESATKKLFSNDCGAFICDKCIAKCKEKLNACAIQK